VTRADRNDTTASFPAVMGENGMSESPRHVVLVAFEGAQLLDVAGPLQAFATASELLGEVGLPPAYGLTVASRVGGPVATSSGLVLATVPLSAASRDVDTFLVAGGPGVHGGYGRSRTPRLGQAASGTGPARLLRLHGRFRAGGCGPPLGSTRGHALAIVRSSSGTARRPAGRARPDLRARRVGLDLGRRDRRD